MAEPVSAVSAVVVSVSITTIRLLVEEAKFLSGVTDQVKGLQTELEALESYLNDANAKKHEDESVLTWVRQARRLAYRSEDTIEEYAIKVASKQRWGFRRVLFILGEAISTHKAGNEIGKIKTEIAELNNRLESHGIDQIIKAEPSPAAIEKQRQLRTTYAHEKDEYFVGMKDDVSKIVTWVTEDDEICRVISISGFGGLGKTTIARKVYNHCQVQSSFECFAWVSVTQQSQIKMLLQSILIQILGDKEHDNIKDMEEDGLVRKLYDLLQNKKCFVVLDDIWEINDWARLRKAFPIFEGRSKILLTTRTSEVAKVAHSQHEPTLLEEKDGWDLLTKIAFNLKEDRGVDKLQENVEAIGRDILRKCGGLPLAIAAIGGVLRNKDPLTEWKVVNDKFGIHMRENDGIVSVLAFSYDNLSTYLRPCFLYMGCFREDEEIDVFHLYQLWMAEGLIPSSKQGQGESLMDAASDVLDELISRHLVQSQVRNVLTDKRSCRLHDLVRELCLIKGKEEEFMEFERKQFIEKDEVCVIQYDSLDLCRKSIMVDIDLMKGVEISANNTYIRSLMLYCSETRYYNGPVFKFDGNTVNFKRLRSLVLYGCRFKDNELPKEIRGMIHLRYLNVQYTLSNGTLPAFIGDLQYLQTLNLANNGNIELPNIFHMMKRLRCLYLPHNRKSLENGKRLEFHGLDELEVVEGFDGEYDEVSHVSELVNLRRLTARIWEYVDLNTIMEQLSSLLKVQYISITFNAHSRSQLEKSFLLCRRLHNLKLWAPIGNFPRYKSQFWPDLVFLELYKTKFEEDPMPFLQELPNLRELTISWDAYVGKDMYCSSKAFPKLTSLSLLWLRNIEIWKVDAGAFPSLSTLDIGHCNPFEILPDGLTNITSLTRIKIDGMPEEFNNKYRSLWNTL